MYGVYPFGVPYFADALYDVAANSPVIVSSVWDDSECKVRECGQQPDIEVYSLQDALLFNTTPLSFIIQCPTGYICPPGTFPQVFTYPPGTFVLPNPTPNPGFPIVLSLEGCQSTVTITLPAGATQAQINTAAQQVFLAVAQQQAECDAAEELQPQPSPLFLNQQVTYSIACEDGETLTYSGNLPGWITLDADNNRLIVAAGIFAGNTQALANTAAQNALNEFANNAVLAGDLECVAAGDCQTLFSGIAWDAPSYFIGTGVGSLDISAATNQIEVDGDFVGEDGWSGSITGTVSYTGDSIDCQAIVTMSLWEAFPTQGGSGLNITITSDIDGELLNETLSYGDGGATGGPAAPPEADYPFPFTVPASAGATLTCVVSVSIGAGALGMGGTAAITATVVIGQ